MLQGPPLFSLYIELLRFCMIPSARHVFRELDRGVADNHIVGCFLALFRLVVCTVYCFYRASVGWLRLKSATVLCVKCIGDNCSARFLS